MVEVKLIRPLDGKSEGDTADYPENDAKRLEKRGAVKIIGPSKQAAAPENKMEQAHENKDVSRAAPAGRKVRSA